MIPSPVTQYLEDTLISWLLMRSILCHPAKENCHRDHETVVSSVVELIFKEIAMHANAMASNHLSKANR